MLLRNTKHFWITSIIIIISSLKLSAQSAQENLDNGYKAYTELSEEIEKISGPTTQDVAENISLKASAAIDFFGRGFTDGDTQQKLACTYYQTATCSKMAQVLTNLGAYQEALDWFIACDKEVSQISKIAFPLKFQIQGYLKTIDVSDFTPIKNNHYYHFGLLSFKTKEWARSREKFAEVIDNLPAEQKYIAYNCYVDMQVRSPWLFADKEEQSKNWIQSIISYTEVLSHNGNQEIKEMSQTKPLTAAKAVFDLGSEENASQGTLGHCAQIATYLVKADSLNVYALKIYNLCFRKYRSCFENGYDCIFTGSNPLLEFCQTAEQYARTMVNYDKTMAEFVGLSATKKMSVFILDLGGCGAFFKHADNFKFWNSPTEEIKYRKMGENCYAADQKNKKRKKR